ncbi:MAG: restriction endonuclease subunit S [Bacteroidales bacterium]|nr:restriction endonuclease subunit S [Bacteroidales bacterium]
MNSGELNLKFVYDVEGRITEEGLNNSSTHIIPAKCVLVGLAGQGKTRGTAAYNLVSLCTNQSIAAFLPTDTHSSLYLYYVIDSLYDYLRLLSSGDGGRGGLNKQILSSLNIVLPPLPEQKAIAEALSDVDDLITALDKKIAKKRLVKQGAMQELLTGKKRLPGFKEEWEEKKVKDIFKVTRGYVLSTNKTVERPDGYYKYPVYSSQTQNNGIMGYYSEYLFNDAITWTTDGANAGEVNLRRGKFYCTNVCGVLINEEGYSNDCIASIINMVAKSYVSYIGNPKLMNNVMAEINICIPSSIEEQQAIATILSDMDKEIADLEAQRDKYLLLKSGMMQKLLTGQIRLKTE